MSRPSDAERLLREWSPDKVRILNEDTLWWRWDDKGYTQDMASAGLYEADWKPWRDEDKVVRVDPERFAIDRIMAAFAAKTAECKTLQVQLDDWNGARCQEKGEELESIARGEHCWVEPKPAVSVIGKVISKLQDAAKFGGDTRLDLLGEAMELAGRLSAGVGAQYQVTDAEALDRVESIFRALDVSEVRLWRLGTSYDATSGEPFNVTLRKRGDDRERKGETLGGVVAKLKAVPNE